ncbi:unnamed protein product [Parajaminaea phylloscopi]
MSVNDAPRPPLSGTYEMSPVPPPFPPPASGFTSTEASTALNTPRESASWTRQLDKAAQDPTFVPDDIDLEKEVAAKEFVKSQADPYVVKYSGTDDPLHPYQINFWVKVAIGLTVAFNAFIVSAFGSAYLFITPNLELVFHSNQSLVITGFVVYVLGWGPGPLIWAPLSDSIGRKPVYIGSVFLWTLFNIGCARAQSIDAMIVCRFFAGFFGCACMTNGGGTNTDVWAGIAIARSISLYSAVVFLGPVIGPIIGGAIQTYSPSATVDADGGWRWLFYAAIMSGVVSTISHILLPETHANIRLRPKVKAMRKKDPENAALYSTEADKGGLSLPAKMKRVAGSAIKMLQTEPIIIFVSLWQTTAMAIIYLFFDAFPVVFGLGHGMNAFQTGLTFIGCGVGMLAACFWSLTVDLKMWVMRVQRAKGVISPEMRLPQGLLGAVLTVVGLFWFGYTTYTSIHWIVPVIGSAVYGFGALNVMLCTFAYVVDTYMLQSAPAFAAIGLIRSIVTGVLPLCGGYFYKNLNPRNATLILACIALAEVAIPLCAMKWGKSIRHKSHFAMKTD